MRNACNIIRVDPVSDPRLEASVMFALAARNVQRVRVELEASEAGFREAIEDVVAKRERLLAAVAVATQCHAKLVEARWAEARDAM